MFPREHGVHGPAQLVREYRQGLGFAMLLFAFGKICFAGLPLADKEDRGFGNRPAQMDGADLFAGRAESVAVGCFGTFHQATGGHKILHPRKALEVVNLI